MRIWKNACANGLMILVAACSLNTTGDLSATKTGDLSNPPAERRAPGVDLVAACGDGASTPAGRSSLLRQPYLQLVGGRTATVVWVTAGSAAEDVELTRPDGTPVAVVAARPADGNPPEGRQLRATFVNLEPNRVYCYRIRSDGEAMAERTGFRTAPAAGTGVPVRFVAFGDSGDGSSDQYAVAEELGTVPFDLMIHTGDIIYPSGEAGDYQSKFFDVYGALLVNFPMFPASGNHDYQTDDAEPYRDAFVLPENGGPNGVERWFSFDWGDVHFVALDTEKVGAEQAAWLDADLAGNRLPWTIVYAHKPPYSSGEHGSERSVRDTFGPIFEKHHVPLVLSGHDHHYERSKTIRGVTYVLTGGGGRGTRPVGTSDFTAFSEQVLNFVYVTVEPNELLLHAIDGMGDEFDTLLIRR